MAGDSLRHNLTKLALARALQDAVAEAGSHCAVFTDGVYVIDDGTPAAGCSVQCGPLATSTRCDRGR